MTQNKQKKKNPLLFLWERRILQWSNFSTRKSKPQDQTNPWQSISPPSLRSRTPGHLFSLQPCHLSRGKLQHPSHWCPIPGSLTQTPHSKHDVLLGSSGALPSKAKPVVGEFKSSARHLTVDDKTPFPAPGVQSSRTLRGRCTLLSGPAG